MSASTKHAEHFQIAHWEGDVRNVKSKRHLKHSIHVKREATGRQSNAIRYTYKGKDEKGMTLASA